MAALELSEVDLPSLKRDFNLHANDVFISAFGQALMERVCAEAPHVLLRFSEWDREDTVLEDGKVDRTSALCVRWVRTFTSISIHDEIRGMARDAHPIFDQEITPEHFARYEQISVSRRGQAVITMWPYSGWACRGGCPRGSDVPPAFFMLGSSDLILTVPEHVAWAKSTADGSASAVVQAAACRSRRWSL